MCVKFTGTCFGTLNTIAAFLEDIAVVHGSALDGINKIYGFGYFINVLFGQVFKLFIPECMRSK